MFYFDGSYKFIFRHPGNHTGDRTDGEYTEGCQPAGVFEDSNELGEERVQKPFDEIRYSGPFFDQPSVSIMGGAKLCINALWDGTLNKLSRTQELRRRNTDNSQTKEILERELQLCQARLKAIPEEQRRLVEGYRKGLYADFMMREDMELVQKEQAEIEKREAELERQLAQRFLTQNHEAHIRSLTEKISVGLDNLDFTGKQELLRLLVEKVVYNGQGIEILTIIPLGEQLYPLHRGGLRG